MKLDRALCLSTFILEASKCPRERANCTFQKHSTLVGR